MWLTPTQIDRIVRAIGGLGMDMRGDRRQLFLSMLGFMEGLSNHDNPVSQIENDVLTLIEQHTFAEGCRLVDYLNNAVMWANRRDLRERASELSEIILWVQGLYEAHLQAQPQAPGPEPTSAILPDACRQLFIRNRGGHNRPLVNYDDFRDDLQELFDDSRAVLWMPDELIPIVATLLTDLTIDVARRNHWYWHLIRWRVGITARALVLDVIGRLGGDLAGNTVPDPRWWASQIVDHALRLDNHVLLIFTGFRGSTAHEIRRTLAEILLHVLDGNRASTRVCVVLLDCELRPLFDHPVEREIRLTVEGPPDMEIVQAQVRQCFQHLPHTQRMNNRLLNEIMSFETIQQINEQLQIYVAPDVGDRGR